MAEDLDKEEKGQESGTKKSSNLVLIIVIVFLVLTLLIGVVMVMLLATGDEEVPQQTQSAQSSGSSQSASRSVGGERTKMPSLEIGYIYPLDGFTVNLLSDSGRRYLKASLNLELKDEKAQQELDLKMAVIRDLIIQVLSSNTLESIATAKGKEKLKDTLVNQINMRLKDAQVINIYFVDFVIQ
ncbi:MAG: hypothetical protein KU37_09545 [Sulfuricurvum sp. PC08-66]|nr:MAG: hypothetical protein KU37_09545 [Sulfuricurvum sp. PC08-66]